jgi:hypothetical protein
MPKQVRTAAPPCVYENLFLHFKRRTRIFHADESPLVSLGDSPFPWASLYPGSEHAKELKWNKVTMMLDDWVQYAWLGRHADGSAPCWSTINSSSFGLRQCVIRQLLERKGAGTGEPVVRLRT